ncbi:MAG TPA: lysophospholipid acyltransferase family protein, partial [Candidatus Dormibacteraeota bacterium]|nr:lysophospholipid acyltransferase family protein [Candidatus Dormibacteraeota bacterium]
MQASLLFPALSSFCRLDIRDRDQLRGLNGPAVFVANHVSALDAVVMAEALPRRYRNRSVVVAAADSIFKRKWEARLAQVTVDAFPIPRSGGARPHLDFLKDLLRKNWSVIIFPEGRLTVTGNIGTFKKGAA